MKSKLEIAVARAAEEWATAEFEHAKNLGAGGPGKLAAAHKAENKFHAALSALAAIQAQPDVAVGVEDENIEADAYNYACELMEDGWRERAKRRVEIGTQGSLCDGIGWIFARMKALEIQIAAIQAQGSDAA